MPMLDRPVLPLPVRVIPMYVGASDGVHPSPTVVGVLVRSTTTGLKPFTALPGITVYDQAFVPACVSDRVTVALVTSSVT